MSKPQIYSSNRTVQQLFLVVTSLSVISTVLYAVVDYFSRESAHVHGSWSYFSPMVLNMVIPILVALGLWLSRTKRRLDVDALFLIVLCTFMVFILFQALLTLITAIASLFGNGYMPADTNLTALVTLLITSIAICYLRRKKQW